MSTISSDTTEERPGETALANAAPKAATDEINDIPFRDEARADYTRITHAKLDDKTKKNRTVAAWIAPLTKLHKLPITKRIWVYLTLMCLYTVAAHFITASHFTPQFLKEAISIGTANLVLGLLLVFRTNSAYERWSEGRRLWGQLMNESRSLSLKVSRYLEIPDEEKWEFGELIVSFAYALKHHLRDSVPSLDLPGIRPTEELAAAHVPVHITDTMYKILHKWFKKGYIDSMILGNLDHHLSAYMDVTGACERIRSTPLALSYRAFIRQGIAINLLVMPLYITATLPLYWAVPLTVVACYFLIGLELIAEEIEDPFGHDSDDLPLDTICERVCVTVYEIMRRKPTTSISSDVLKFTKSYPKPKFNPLT
ncbi:MAG TPA: bestrophin family protein [Oculatellaceae cyanobacterium]